MDEFLELMDKLIHMNIIKSIIAILLSALLYSTAIHFIFKDRKHNSLKFLETKKGKTYFKMTKSIIKYSFVIVTLFVILQINGINVTSMLAGVGVISVIIAFAVQDVLKDMVRGIGIITDQYYHVGDVIKYNNIEGKVLSVGIKTTKIEDLKTFNVVCIANRNIEIIENVSTLINLDVPMPYEVSINDAEKAIECILSKMKNIDKIDNCEYRGVNEIADSCIKYQIKAYCNPIYKMQVRRDCLRAILVGLAECNINVPYNQIDVHNK